MRKETEKVQLLVVKVKAWQCSACGAVMIATKHGNREGDRPTRCWKRKTCGKGFLDDERPPA